MTLSSGHERREGELPLAELEMLDPLRGLLTPLCDLLSSLGCTEGLQSPDPEWLGPPPPMPAPGACPGSTHHPTLSLPSLQSQASGHSPHGTRG